MSETNEWWPWRNLMNWASAVGGAQHSLSPCLTHWLPNPFQHHFLSPSPCQELRTKVWVVYKEPIIYEEAGLKIILVSYAEIWGGTGGPKEGWLTWPEKGDFERCLGKVELCQIRRLCVPV